VALMGGGKGLSPSPFNHFTTFESRLLTIFLIVAEFVSKASF